MHSQGKFYFLHVPSWETRKGYWQLATKVRDLSFSTLGLNDHKVAQHMYACLVINKQHLPDVSEWVFDLTKSEAGWHPLELNVHGIIRIDNGFEP